MSLLSVAACAPATTDSAARPATTTPAAAATTTTAATQPTAAATPKKAADCTKATRVAIDADGFSPAKVTLQRGGFLFLTNKSDEVHALSSTADSGMVKSVLDAQEHQIIQFPQAGTFTVTTGDAALKLTVAGESGCDTPEPTLTIEAGSTIKPARVSLVATENFTVINKSGTAQTWICAPDPGGNGDNTRLEKGETQLLAVDKPGTYACASTLHPTAKVTLTVTAK